MRVFFEGDLDTVATYWRVYRRDGAMFAFTSHDRDLFFSGITHKAAPGMVPSAIRLSADLTADSAEVEGALTHATISERDLRAGLFDNAAIEIGVVSWENFDHHAIYFGELGGIEDDRFGFSAELRSAKHVLEKDYVPRTSPTCRAEFCGPGCGLSARQHSARDSLKAIDVGFNRVQLLTASGPAYIDGRIRLLDGPQTGLVFSVVDVDGQWLILDRALVQSTALGTPVEIREGCDHTLATCHARFSNAINFRGEPFLPGNDLLARYGQGAG